MPTKTLKGSGGMYIGRGGWGEISASLRLPMSLSILYHNYLFVAVVGGGDMVLVDGGICNVVIYRYISRLPI